MGRFVITMPPISYARELWRFGEAELAHRASVMNPSACVDVGERAGALSSSGEAIRLWPDGPRGHTSAILLAAVEHFEGRPRPCARTRRLPEKSLPTELQVDEDERWALTEAVSREMDSRLRRDG